jgi:diguanylate cyclase (GGDEF)-like protein
VGRYGGEEFLILLPGCGGGQLELCAERIRLAISSEPIRTEGLAIHVTVSIGSVVADTTHRREKEALSVADAALYEAKRQGRDRVVCLDMSSAKNILPSTELKGTTQLCQS